MLKIPIAIVLFTFASIKSLELGVDGLACPFCALGLENNLKKVNSIETVEVHLKKGIADVAFKPNVSVDFNSLEKAVVDAGFTLRDAKIKVSGQVSQEGDNWKLISSGDKTIFMLVGDSQKPMPKSLIAKLMDAYRETRSVTITGMVHVQKEGGIPGIFVQTIELEMKQ